MTRVLTRGVKIITPPAEEQITLAEARLQLSLDDDGDSPPSHPLDSLIADKISAAREYCEDYLGRSLAQQTVELSLDQFYASGESSSGAIELPLPPVISITSVIYLDVDGEPITMDEDAYRLDNYSEPAWLFPAYGTTWPAAYAVSNAVKIRALCGYSLRDDSPETNPLPAKYRQAMMVLMTDMVMNRGEPSEKARQAAENLMDLGSVRMLV